ncbi:hypothetical protein SBADM41S_05402 [Streptomyces badius]
MSRLSVIAISSRSRWRSSATRRSSPARSATGRCGQGPSSKARRAAAIAASVSATPPSATTAKAVASAGSRTVRVSPDTAARQVPSMWMVLSSSMSCLAFRA